MKIASQWDLTRLFYRSLKDPRLLQDVERGENAIDQFAKKYAKDKSWLKQASALAQAIKDFEALILKNSSKPYLYVMYRKELDATDKEAEAFLNKLEERYTRSGNKTIFFGLELAKVPKEKQKEFLRAPELEPYGYWLMRLFENAKHDLSEPEEKILSLLGDVSFGRWVQLVENILNTRTVRFEGKTLPFNEAREKVNTLPKEKRRILHRALMETLANVAEVAEGELNAVVTRKKITDEIRGFKEPYDATILGYENDRESVLTLVQTITAHFYVAQRFYKVKAKLLNEKTLTYADRAVPIGAVKKKIPFVEAANIVRDTFYKLHPSYAQIFERLLKNGQVDVYPKPGKSGGAYCSHTVTTPTLVLLNSVDDAHSLLTLAHEMGHAIHSEKSREQRPMYQDYSIVTAETASTFFERAAFFALVETLSAEEKIIALHDRMQDDVATIFRQIAAFNFETELHKEIRTRGLLPKEEIAKLMNKHMAAYLGNAVKLEPNDGYFFVGWSHIRRFFYVYSYAYGLLVSRALWEKVQQDPNFIGKVDAFLRAGGSASPEDIFAKCGLDLYKPDVFLAGLKSIEKDLETLEKLSKKK